VHSLGINGEGELRGQPANPVARGGMAVKTECVYVTVFVTQLTVSNQRRNAVLTSYVIMW